MSDLMSEFGLTVAQAAGFVGNLAHESAGFRTLQEISPVVPGSRGGFGFAQWTASRRRNFESWSRARGLNPASYEANWGFLRHELTNTPERRVLNDLRRAKTPEQAAHIVSKQFLRPGKPHNQSRVAFANHIHSTIGPNTPAVALASLPAPDPNAGTLARSAQFAGFEPAAYSAPGLLSMAAAAPVEVAQAPSQAAMAGLLMDTFTPPAAPVAPVERASLPGPNVAQSYQGFSRAMGMPNAAPVAPVERAALPDLPSQRVETAMMAPAARPPAPDLASFRSMASMPTYAAMTQPSLQQQLELSPVALPAALPSVPTPAARPAPAPQQQQASQTPSGFDVWDGAANFGIAQGGYELTRLDDGNIARYSPQFDRTTIVDQNNNVQRSFKGRMDANVPGPVGAPAGIAASLNPMGLRSPARTDMGRAVRGTLGGMTGAMAGGAFAGPIGGLIGGLLGRQATAGGLLSRGPFGAQWTAPSMGWASAPTVDARGFPSAPPSPPGGGGNYSDFDFDAARGISPGAAEAARGGRAGLF